MSHTPTPWQIRGTIDGESQINGSGWVDLAPCTEEFKVIGSLYHHHHTGEQNLANAEFIVKAVNAHADLVAALKGVTDLYTSLVHSGDAGFWDPEEEEPIVAAREALAKAGA